MKQDYNHRLNARSISFPKGPCPNVLNRLLLNKYFGETPIIFLQDFLIAALLNRVR